MDGKLDFDSSSMLGPGGSTRGYSDQSGGKPLMPLQALNLPAQDQGGPHLTPCSPMLPKNGARRPGLWGATSSNGPQKDWINGRSGMMEMDFRPMPSDYPSALLDQTSAPLTDPYRVPGGLARYHSAPSALLQSLADFQQDVVPRPMSQLDNSLSSFFTDAELPPLNPSTDTSLEQMETEHSSNSVYDKYMLNTRKFDRLGKPGGHYDQLGPVNGPTKPPIIQSVYKHSMEVLHENLAGNPQMNSQLNTEMNSQLNAQMNSQMNSQMPSSMGLSSSIGLSSTMGLLGQQDNTHAGQMSLGNLGQSIGNDFCVGSSGTLGGLTSTRLAHKGNNNNSLLRQSSSPAGLLAQLSIDVQAMAGAAKSEKPSLSSPLAHSPAESLSGGTSEENGGAGTGPGTPGMMSRMDVGWEDAQSYLNSWDNTNFAARKRFRDMEIDPLGDPFMADPLVRYFVCGVFSTLLGRADTLRNTKYNQLCMKVLLHIL